MAMYAANGNMKCFLRQNVLEGSIAVQVQETQSRFVKPPCFLSQHLCFHSAAHQSSLAIRDTLGIYLQPMGDIPGASR